MSTIQAGNRAVATSARLGGHWQSVVADVSSDQRAFKGVPWGKPMMWIFLLSDTFIFGSFLISYMTVRMSTTVPWPSPSEVFALTVFGQKVPLLLIAIMTFVLISSSGTMALAVNYGYRRNRKLTFALLLATAALGATFVGMQAFEWYKLISEGVRPWGNPWGAAQFGSAFFMITGFHGTHVTIGVIFLLIVALKVRGDLDVQRPGFLTWAPGQLRDRRDPGPVLALRGPGVGLHLRVLLSLVDQEPSWTTPTIRMPRMARGSLSRRRKASSTRSGSTSRSGPAVRAERGVLHG